MKEILLPIAVLAALGCGFGVLLSIASRIFYVDMDPKVVAILDSLPGANCGACGFPGCEGLANAIASGAAPVTGCTIGGQATAEKVAQIMGVNAGSMSKQVAVVMCKGDCSVAKDKFEYKGIMDCRAMNDLSSGQKLCTYGCLGGGTCKTVCEFDAIEIVDGIAVIDKDKCVSCKKCITVCPKNLIKLVPYDNEVIVKCNSEAKGKEVKAACSVGCIGCKMCVKACPEGCIEFENNLARIDYSKCTQCEACWLKCPTKAIFSGKEVHAEPAPKVEKPKAEEAVAAKTE